VSFFLLQSSNTASGRHCEKAQREDSSVCDSRLLLSSSHVWCHPQPPLFLRCLLPRARHNFHITKFTDRRSFLGGSDPLPTTALKTQQPPRSSSASPRARLHSAPYPTRSSSIYTLWSPTCSCRLQTYKHGYRGWPDFHKGTTFTFLAGHNTCHTRMLLSPRAPQRGYPANDSLEPCLLCSDTRKSTSECSPATATRSAASFRSHTHITYWRNKCHGFLKLERMGHGPVPPLAHLYIADDQACKANANPSPPVLSAVTLRRPEYCSGTHEYTAGEHTHRRLSN
jgi:hypothetical protein